MTAVAVQWAERIMRRIDGTFPTEYQYRNHAAFATNVYPDW